MPEQLTSLESVHIKILRTMSQFFQHLEEKHGLHMDGRMRESFTAVKILLDFYTATFKTTGRRNAIPLPRSVRTLHKRSSRMRRRWKKITHLLCKQVPARRRNTIHPIQKTRPSPYHSSSKTHTVLPKPSHHHPDILPFKEYPTQTRTLRTIDEVGCQAKQTSH